MILVLGSLQFLFRNPVKERLVALDVGMVLLVEIMSLFYPPVVFRAVVEVFALLLHNTPTVLFEVHVLDALRKHERVMNQFS